jgi:hypothetical protein
LIEDRPDRRLNVLRRIKGGDIVSLLSVRIQHGPWKESRRGVTEAPPTPYDRGMKTHQYPYDAVIFDLLTALLDSWTLWRDVAGSSEAGMA